MTRTIHTPIRYPGGEEYRESLFFAIKQKYPYKQYWINDLNPELFNFWKTCQEDIDSVIDTIFNMKNRFRTGKELFYDLRRSLKTYNSVQLAGAYFILNRTSFSGFSINNGE